MAQVKGILILGLIKFMKKGMKEAIPQIMSVLPQETKKYMEEHILPAGWYPYRVDAITELRFEFKSRGE